MKCKYNYKFYEILFVSRPKLIICSPKLIYYKKSIPTVPDEVFVIGVSYKVNKNNKIKHLRVVFTTLTLLHAKKNKLKADETYKLNWNGLPVPTL